MAAIQGQPAPKPQSLNDPVPDDELSAAAKAFMAEETASLPSPDGVESAGIAEDSPVGDVAAAAQTFIAEEQTTTGQVPEDQFAPEPGFVQANIEQFANAGVRAQAGLAANDTEKLNFLRQKYGNANATMKNGELYFRKDTAEKFKKLDPAAFELLNDVVPDWSREIIQEAVMLPGEIAAGVAAFGVPGIAAARAVSFPVANAIADEVADLAGIPRDESRSLMTENLTGSAMEATLPVIGSRIVGPAVKQMTKKLPGTMAYKAAREAGKRETIALSKQSAEVAKSITALNEVGKAAKIDADLVGIPGAELNLMGHQLQPDNPILKGLANQAANDPKFIEVQRQLAEDWGALAENTLKEIGRSKIKGPVKEEALSKFVTNAVDDLVELEGKAIQKYRTKALSTLKNEVVQIKPDTKEKVQGLLQEFNFSPKKVEKTFVVKGKRVSQVGTKWVAPKDVEPLIGKFGIKSAGEARAFVNNIEELSKGLEKGFRISDVDKLRNSLGEAGSSLYGTNAGRNLSQLSGDMRQLFRETISSGLEDDVERAAFNAAMDNFSALKVHTATLKNALIEDASSKAIVRKFFTGADNLQKIKAIKKISPEGFESLREEFSNQLLIDYASRSSATGFKSSQFLDGINKKYGNEFLNEVFGKEGVGQMKNILNVTERIEKTFKSVDYDVADSKKKRAVADIAIGLVANIKFKMANGVSAIFRGQLKKDHILYQLMTREGIDKYVANYPGKIDKVGTIKKFNNILADWKFHNTAKALEKTAKGVEKAGKGAARGAEIAIEQGGGRATRATVRQESIVNEGEQ